MKDAVRQGADAKFAVFDQYFDVPAEVAGELARFREAVMEMAETCDDPMEFENRFASEFAGQYNLFFTRCTPRAVPLTAEQKAEAERQVEAMGLKEEFRKDAIRQAKEDAILSAKVDLESAVTTAKREAMIEAGVFDDYTRMTNKVEDAKIIGKFLKGKFGKK